MESSRIPQDDGLSIVKPIFIVGPHRSGTTLLYKLLGRHPQVGYLNRANKRFPAWPRLAHLLTRMGSRDAPMEAQAVWDRARGPQDDVLTADQVTPEVRRFYRGLVSRVLDLRGAKRFVAKYPRLSVRLGWLDAIFPDAIFIHMARDWRAVVHSTVVRRVKREKRQGGWFGVRVPGWRDLQGLPHELASARIYRHVTEVLEQAARDLGPRVVRASYEELCSRPVESLRRLAERLELAWSPEFETTIPRDLRSANFKWREGLDPEKLERCRAEAPDLFSRYEEKESEKAPAR
jgi:hypothetical protein